MAKVCSRCGKKIGLLGYQSKEGLCSTCEQEGRQIKQDKDTGSTPVDVTAAIRVTPKWQSSKPYLQLLCNFRSPRFMDEFVHSEYWAEDLSEKPENVIKMFIDEGLVRKGDLNEKMDAKFKVSELKSLSKARNLPLTGKKAALIEKLIQSDRSSMESLLNNAEILTCTEKGRAIADEFLKGQEEIKNRVELTTISLLREGKFREAIKTVADYRGPPRVIKDGSGINWGMQNPDRDESKLKTIFSKTPSILRSLEKEQIDALRIAAGMMVIWGSNSGKKWLPENFSIPLQINVDTAVRMLSFHGSYLYDIKRFKNSDIKFVQILSTETSCENCKKYAGKKYPIDQVVELPNPECTHEMGCRCCLTAIIDIPR